MPARHGNTKLKPGPRKNEPMITSTAQNMPAWGAILTDQEVNDVVCYERVVLSGQDPVPPQCTTEGAAGEATGS